MPNMNGSNRVRSMASLTNQNQGGGPKKAGLVPTEAISTAQRETYAARGYLKPLSTMQFTMNPKVKQSRPVWVRPGHW